VAGLILNLIIYFIKDDLKCRLKINHTSKTLPTTYAKFPYKKLSPPPLYSQDYYRRNRNLCVKIMAASSPCLTSLGNGQAACLGGRGGGRVTTRRAAKPFLFTSLRVITGIDSRAVPAT